MNVRLRDTFVAALALGLVVLPREARAQAQPQASLAFAASSFASTEVHLNSRKIGGEWYGEDAGLTGPSRIAIAYGQPHARGRKVEGGLIPLDTVWRFGANAAAQLTTDHDLEIGGAAVPAGSYSLWLLPSAGQSYLIVNAQTGQWGTMYDSSKDVVRIPVSRHVVAGSREERFRVSIDAGKLLMVWDDGGYEVPLTGRP